MRRNRKRREKLGDLCFELAKYILTAIVIGKFVDPDVTLFVFLVGLGLSLIFLVLGYFLFPLDQKEAENV